MSSNPGATAEIPEEYGKHLEDSLNHLVDSSTEYGGQKDELARMSSLDMVDKAD